MQEKTIREKSGNRPWWVGHPMVALMMLCLFCTALFTVGESGKELISPEMWMVLLVGALGALAAVLPKGLSPQEKGVTAAGFALLALTAAGTYRVSNNRVLWLMVMGTLLCFAAGLLWYMRGVLTTRKWIVLLLGMGFLLRLCYVLYTGAEERQHDVHFFGGPDGHAAYIEYLFNNHRLPQTDPSQTWQFYHPPLHHVLAASFLQLLTRMGFSWERAKESIQMLTLFYSSLCMLLSYRLFRECGLQKGGLIAAMSLICFHPTFILLAGSINNDILSITFFLGAILWAIRWYKNPGFAAIGKLGLCIGLGMMTKLSVALVAPGVAVLFLLRLIQQPAAKRLWGQFTAFAGISMPLGLWWGVRNLVRFRLPPTYVPMLSDTNWQYVGDHSILDRLFNFSVYQFETPFTSFGNVAPYFEFNPTIGLLKTAMFGEFNLSAGRPEIVPFATVLFWLGLVLAVGAFGAFVFLFCRKDPPLSRGLSLFFGVQMAVGLFSYYQFCLAYAHTCTQDIRYATPLIVIGALSLGLLIQRLGKPSTRPAGRVIRGMLFFLCGGFCVFSAFTYTFLGV